MKKLLVFLFSLLLFSCGHDAVYQSAQEVKEIQYEQAFEQAFGKISPTQTWGFLTSNTRTANTNGNQWEGKGYTIPADITSNELEAVLEVFNKKGNVSYTSLIDWNEYFVQQVYKGEAKYKNHDNQTVTGSEHMDWLCTVTNKKVNVKCWYPYEEEIIEVPSYDDHINNFNNGKNDTWMTSETSGKKFKGITLMQNTNSTKFGFKSSEDNGHVFYNFRMEEINGNYYVGFDFEANGTNKNEQVDRDYIYNDWIVKIVPGKGITPPVDPVKEEGRIICEDLGGIGDFDFNDVVFDATIYESGRTVITVQAAGGTLPILVAGENISNVMGYMVNTIKGGTTHEPYTFTANNTYNSLVEIPVVVINKDNTNHLYEYELKAVMGKAPQKIKVPTTFRWCQEYAQHSIDKAYPGFTEWVTGGTFWGTVNEEHIY